MGPGQAKLEWIEAIAFVRQIALVVVVDHDMDQPGKTKHCLDDFILAFRFSRRMRNHAE